MLFEGTDRLYRTTSRTFQVVECSACNLVRLHPWPSPEELRTFYPENYWFEPEAGSAARLEELYRRTVLRDHLQFVRSALRDVPSGPVLDVGCGGALFGRLLTEFGYRTFGLDFSAQAAHVAWRQNGIAVAVGDLARAPFAPRTFAVVTMFHVVEHLYDPGEYLRAAHQCLCDDGRLIVQVPNRASWQAALLGEKWNGFDVPRHLIDFSSENLDALLLRCGFEPVRHKYFSLRDNPAGLASSLAPDLDPMARRIRKGEKESNRTRLLRDILYLALTVAAVPFTVLEAALGAGSTVMVEARKRPA